MTTKFLSAKYQVTKLQNGSTEVTHISDGQRAIFSKTDVVAQRMLATKYLNDKSIAMWAIEDGWFM